MAVDYNDLLYEKAQKEYNDLIAELKELPSEQVIERAYEKVIKENILCILEDSQRDQKEAKALYLEKYPLDRAYQDWLKSDVSGTAMLRDSIDDTANDESKMNGMLPNRAVYAEPETVEMSYQEMTKRFREAENNRKEHLTGYVVFTEDSFDKPYSEESRTYVISSNNKAFQSGMGGYSIYASCLDGTDPCLRLDGYMSAEHGGENGWKIEKCYMKENSREMLDIIFGQFFIAYAPIESENFQSLPKNLAEKYKEKFKYPERIAKVNGEIVAVPFKPKTKEAER